MNDSKTIINMIKDRRVELNMSQRELAKLTNLNNSTLSRYENFEREFPINDLPKFAKALNLDVNYLLGVEDKNSDDVDLSKIPGIILPVKMKKIPILGTIACGEPIFAEENYEGYFMLDTNLPEADFILKAKGDSMIDADIYEGDLVFFRRKSVVDNGTIAAVIIEDEATLKKLYKNEHTIVLQPCNSNYAPIVLSENDHKNIMVLGEMVGVYSKRNK